MNQNIEDFLQWTISFIGFDSEFRESEKSPKHELRLPGAVVECSKRFKNSFSKKKNSSYSVESLESIY